MWSSPLTVIFFVAAAEFSISSAEGNYTLSSSCQSPIYCNGIILQAVQRADLFADPKRFVDMPSKCHELEMMERFWKLGKNPSPSALNSYVNDNFEPAGHELVPVIPTDWKPEIPLFTQLREERIREFARTVHSKWKSLVRRVDFRKICAGCASSVINLPEPFFVPGGRFRELYYWDSYWILEGLYVSDMCPSAGRMISNFQWLIQQYGFVPNGSRTYYLNRSHPPLFAQMVKRYLEKCVSADKKHEWVEKILPYLEIEYAFWRTRRSITLEGSHSLSYYSADTDMPRPEAFLQDELACNVNNPWRRSASEILRNIASGAESGLDFTNRWVARHLATRTNFTESLSEMQVTSLIPVDLNSILHENELIISELYKFIGKTSKGNEFEVAAHRRHEAIQRYLWNPHKHIWMDYNITSKSHNDPGVFYLSNLSPLWRSCHNLTSKEIAGLLQRHEHLLTAFPGGIPFDNTVTGQQWDFPNIWAPFQYYFIKLYDKLAQDTNDTIWRGKALNVAQRFLDSAYCGYKHYGQFFEKYNALKVGMPGGGGEYIVQEGFGWTNGIILWILNKFGNQLQVPVCQLGGTSPWQHEERAGIHGESFLSPHEWIRGHTGVTLLAILGVCLLIVCLIRRKMRQYRYENVTE
jgi:alpha,alpha-trehalase